MLVRAFISLLLALVTMGCGASASPAPASPTTEGTAVVTPTRASPPPRPIVQLPGEPVSYSRVKAEFGQPLSSGISLPDMVENALRSIIAIEVRVAGTPVSGGTGFTINTAGLIVTNKHVVQGAEDLVLRPSWGTLIGADVVGQHPTLDLAYVQARSKGPFTPIAIGDSDNVRVGESVIVVGFPIADRLGSEPTVSQGIVSARRSGGMIQTDAPVNPGNSGGPMLDQFGNVIGVVVSRVEEAGGRDISGIGFAIPINEVTADLGGQVSPGEALPTPLPTARSTLVPPVDLEATKTALAEEDAFLQTKEAAEYQAEQDRLEAERFAASLEATRIANRPTPTPTLIPTPVPTPTPEPTPTPLPTPTPHPQVYCQEWEAMVQDWVREGNAYARGGTLVPDHPMLSADQAHDLCIVAFPLGMLTPSSWYRAPTVGTGEGHLLPGTYQYQTPDGGERVTDRKCKLHLNVGNDDSDRSVVQLTYGEPFQFTFFAYHGKTFLDRWSCNGALYRIGD